jgi:hypothetical protein
MRLLQSVLLSSCLFLPSLAAFSQAPPPTLQHKDPIMARHAAGDFDVKTTPLPPDDGTSGTIVARYALVKQYHGDLEAAAKGEMLGAGDASKGAAGYVAIEQVVGTLQGHSGSFALQHIGALDQNGHRLSIIVVPGSGSGELAGIAGTLTILNTDGKHSYTFDYTLPPTTPTPAP